MAETDPASKSLQVTCYLTSFSPLPKLGPLWQCFSDLSVHPNSLSLKNAGSASGGMKWDPRFCIPNQLPGHAGAASPGTTLFVARLCIVFVIQEPRTLKLKKNDNSKNISRTFSGAFGDSVGSVHFQIVPWPGLYFSRSVGPFLCRRC